MADKIKIGLFVDTFFPMMDGVVSVVDNYAKRLCKYADVTVFTVDQGDYDFSSMPYKVVRCHALKVMGLDYVLGCPNSDKKFKKALKESNLDIVHIHSPFTIGKVGVKYAKKHNIPAVATNHSQFKQDFYKATKSDILTNILLKSIMKVFNSCDENWAVNEEVANVFAGYGAKVKPSVENNATDMQFLSNIDGVQSFYEKYNISEEEKILLFVGRINEIKNIFFLTDCLKALKQKCFKFKMFFVGSGSDEQKLQEKINECGLNDCVFMLGRVMDRQELAKLYNMAHLFVFLSKYDCSSIVQIEAASQKMPTLFLRGAVTANTITEDVNGYLAEEDIENFSNKIISIFENEGEYNIICENVYRDIYINWDTKIEQIFNKYLKLIEDYRSNLTNKDNK